MITCACGKAIWAELKCKACYGKEYNARPLTRIKKRYSQKIYWNSLPKAEQQKSRKNCLNSQHGFSKDLFDKLWSFQDGHCAICNVLLIQLDNRKPGGLCRDHNHNTGKARGLLCQVCNSCLGKYEKYQKLAGLRIEPYEQYLNNPPVAKCDVPG